MQSSATRMRLCRRRPADGGGVQRRNCTARSTAQSSPQHALFQDMLRHCDVRIPLEMRQHPDAGLSLHVSAPACKGDIIVGLQRNECLIVDYATGIAVPPGQWPRLRDGVSAPDPLPWDLLLALALLDALAGEGNQLWQAYADVVLPAPETLTLPFCWDQALLAELQHQDITDGALKQQERLRSLFPPELMEPLAPGVPSWLQWAFACVRSRSFKVGAEAFALVPILDLCNHSPTPNVDLRPASPGATHLELCAVRDIPAGGELLFSYTGEQGYTNQRLQAQYGFVLEGANMADRIVFDVASQPEGGSSSSSTSGNLSLEVFQDALGDDVFASMLRGTSPRLYAALKSLPLTEAAAAAPAPGGPAPADVLSAQRLLAQCEAMLSGLPTSQAQDEELLSGPLADITDAAAQPNEWRLASAVRYRLERKRLIDTCRGLLAAYIKRRQAAA